MADLDVIDVATNDRVIPDARMSTQGHVAKDHRPARDVNAVAQLRFAAQERVELAIEICSIAHKRKNPSILANGRVSLSVPPQEFQQICLPTAIMAVVTVVITT